jgi:hypothetical protein
MYFIPGKLSVKEKRKADGNYPLFFKTVIRQNM